MKQNLPIAFIIIAILWGIHIINHSVKYKLNVLGIYPRHPFGLIGIICSPFLHGNTTHLFFNSIPLFVLMCFILAYGYPVFIAVSIIIMLISGFGVWLFGRRAIHIGASGMVMGYWAFLLASIYFQGTAVAFVLGIISIYYFGTLLFHLIPLDIRTSSWEGHVFGFLGGIAAIFLYPYLLPYLQ